MNLLLTIFSLITLGTHAGTKQDAMRSELRTIQIIQKKFDQISAHFESLKPLDKKDWDQLQGTWQLTTMWFDPKHYPESSKYIAVNPEEYVVTKNTKTNVHHVSFETKDGKNWTAINNETKWHCMDDQKECGWLDVNAKTNKSYLSCRLDVEVNEILCTLHRDPKAYKNVSTTLGKIIKVFKQRTPDEKIIQLKMVLSK